MKKLIILMTLILVSCGEEDKENIENASSDEGGRCLLTTSNTTRFCLVYPDSTLSTDGSDNCLELWDETYETIFIDKINAGQRGRSYEAGKNLDCAGKDVLGTCTDATETTAVATYYDQDSFWSASEAQTDCESNLGGTWC